MKEFFIADPHFDHANILKYCPLRADTFKNIQDMNIGLIKNWNSVVSVDDETTVLGDFAFASIDRISKILSRLNGKKHLIVGNHDKFPWEQYIEAGFETVQRYKYITVAGIGAVGLAHDPSCCIVCPTIPWFVGHLHQQFLRMGNAINVGVDVRGFKPVSLEDLMEDLRITVQCHMKMDPNAEKEILGLHG